MKRIALAAAAAVALAGVPVGAASADETGPSEAVTTCLAAHPDAVAWDAVTDGNDLVCVDTLRKPSAGDDTYLWVGADVDTAMVLRSWGYAEDFGHDTLSLADWSTGYVDQYDENGRGGMFGVRVIGVEVEQVDYTAHDDSIGWLPACSGVTASAGVQFNLGDGNDTVNCVAGIISAGPGDDRLVGISHGTILDAGPGDDIVTGDGDADDIVLGDGADVAYVEDGTEDGAVADLVDAGEGDDVVYADRADVVYSARLVLPAVDPVEPPVVDPEPTLVKECKTVRVHKRVWNKAHTHKVWRWVKVKRCRWVEAP